MSPRLFCRGSRPSSYMQAGIITDIKIGQRFHWIKFRKPNHVEAAYSMECSECHNVNAYEWASTGFNHDFFPLTEGHNIADCAACHRDENFANLSPE